MIVGLCGKLGSGKDQIGAVLTGLYGFKRLAFADALKKVTADLFEIHPENMCHPHKERVIQRWGKSPRVILQEFGCMMRDIHSDVWANKVASQIDMDFTGRYVITDVRFRNEVDMILGRSGQIWKVVRPGLVESEAGNHVSETALDNLNVFSHVIENVGTIADLDHMVIDIANGYGWRLPFQEAS